MVGRLYVGDQQTLLHTKYISGGPHGFREQDFLKTLYHYTSMEANDTLGHGLFRPQVNVWQDLCRILLDVTMH